MAENSNESVSYLASLKRFTGAEPASTPVVEENPGAQGTPAEAKPGTYLGAEKRRSSRFKCEGSAEMREEGCDVRTWATFTDVSVHGCYVEAQATYPVGTILQVKLEARGIRFESRCSVRVNYPYLGMGMAFVDMSEENRAHVRQLLGIISQPGVIVKAAGTGGPVAEIKLALPPIANPENALQALVSYFEAHQMLTREDFLELLGTSQKTLHKRSG